jgi:hypothetical protein
VGTAREFGAFQHVLHFHRAMPTRAVSATKNRVGTARIARIILLPRRVLRAFAHPTARRTFSPRSSSTTPIFLTTFLSPA